MHLSISRSTTLLRAGMEERGGVDTFQFQLPNYGSHPFMSTFPVNPSPKLYTAIHVMTFNTLSLLSQLTAVCRHVYQHTIVCMLGITQSSKRKQTLPPSSSGSNFPSTLRPTSLFVREVRFELTSTQALK